MGAKLMIEAVCLLAVFSKVSLSSLAEKAVRFFTPLSFSVYLIHLNRLFLNHVLKDAFFWITLLEVHEIIIAVFLATLCIYVCCSMADLLRQKLFGVLKVEEVSGLAEKFLGRTVKRLWEIVRLLMFPVSGKNLRTAGRN